MVRVPPTMQGQEFTAIKMVPGAAIVVRIPTDAVALTVRTIPLSPARESTNTDPSASEFDT